MPFRQLELVTVRITDPRAKAHPIGPLLEWANERYAFLFKDVTELPKITDSGTLFSGIVGMVYLILLDEPGRCFTRLLPWHSWAVRSWPETLGAVQSREHKYRAFFISGCVVFSAVLVLFFITYAVLPQFDRTSVLLPE